VKKKKKNKKKINIEKKKSSKKKADVILIAKKKKKSKKVKRTTTKKKNLKKSAKKVTGDKPRKRKSISKNGIRRKRRNQKKALSSQIILGKFLREEEKFEKNFSRALRRLKFWSNFFLRFKKYSIASGKILLRCSWRAGIVALLVITIYSLSPSALCAPQSQMITTKAEWDQGQFSGVTTDTATDAIQLSPSGSWTARTWAPPEDTISFGHSSVMVNNFLYAFRGYSGNAFWRYDTAKNTWSTLAALPQPAFWGADMAYLNGKIYAMFGGYSTKFYSYDISANTWTRLTDMLDTPWQGATMEVAGTSIFVVRGNSSTDFWEFDTTADDGVGAWINRPPVTLAAGVGADLVNGQNGSLYLVRGAGTQNFYRYDINLRRWYATVAQLPSTCGAAANQACTFGGEQRGVFWNGNIFYMRSNGTQDILQYNILGNSWTPLTADMTPQAVNYGSLAFNTTDNYIYAFRANATTDLWKLDPAGSSGQKWIGPKQLQTTAGALQNFGTGGDMVWNQNYGGNNFVYGVQGGGVTGFYIHNLANNSWTTSTNPVSYAPNNDVKGAINPSNGTLYYPRAGQANILIYSGGTAGTWSTMAPAPTVSASDGAGVAFQGTNIYYMPGGGNQNVYKYNGTSWSAAIPMAIAASGTTTTYYANVGARIASDGTNIFVMPGDGETTFLKYNGTSWSTLSSTPFSQYYGADMTYDSANSKVYALAGYYKNETWEYTIATDTWRRIPNNQKFTFDRGPYNGSSIEYVGNSSLYASAGQSLPDVWNYSVPAANFPTAGTYTYTSHKIDLGQVSSGTNFSFNENKPANTTTKYDLCTNADGSACSSWHDVTDGVINDQTLYRYAWIKITLSTTNGASTPTVNDYTITYASSDSAPGVPQNLVSKSSQNGTGITSDTQYVHEHPYFSWSAGTDNGSGIAGYYVYFGKNPDADPSVDGTFQVASAYSVNEAMTYDTSPAHDYGTYYFKVKAKDNNGLISDVWSPFNYLYKGVSPPSDVTKTTQGEFNASGADFDSGKISYSAVDGSLRLNNTSGFWNQTRLSASPYYTYIGSQLTLGGCKTAGQAQMNGNHCVYTFQGNNQLIFMRYEIETDTWTNSTANPTEMAAAPSAVYNGGTIVAGPSGYLYATKGVTTSTFWRYDIVNHVWTQIDDAPKNFDYGSVLVYDNSRYIYAMPGNDDATYRYDTCNGEGGDCTPEWTQLANADFGNPNTVDGQKTYEGADAIYDGRNNMYVMQGNYYPYFTKYSIGDDAGHGENHNSWTPLSAAPIGSFDGGSMSFDGDHTIYVLAGNSRMKLMKYDINTDTWSFLPDAPATISYGASMAFYNGNIYITRGGTYMTFYRFNTTDNTWEIPNHNFFGNTNVNGTVYFPYTNGASMSDDGNGNVYVIRGGFDNLFGKYSTSSGTFTPLSKLPMGAGNGASIVYNGTENAIYYVTGNTIRTRRTGTDTLSPYFFKYNISTNSWTQITTDRPMAQVWLGSSMTYDGSRYIYLTQGNGATAWWKYDTQAAAGSRWSAMSVVGSCASGDGSKILYVGGTIYRTQAGNATTNCKFSGGSWSTLGVLPGAASSGSSLVDGKDGYIYATRGGNTNNYYRYSTSQAAPGSWENLSATNVPAQVTTGGWGINSNSRNWFTSGAGGGTTFSDGLYSYVVGSSANGTGFVKTGTYTSETIDLTQVYRFANLTAAYTLPANTSLEIKTRTSTNGSTWSDWSTVSDDHTSGNNHTFTIGSNSNRYIQVRMIFSSSDQVFSPRLDSYSIKYYQDADAPANPSSISAYNNSGKTQSLTTGTWYNHAAPYFEWPAEGADGGAADNTGGSGIAGYYVYFGTDPNGEPIDFQTGSNYSALNLTSGQTYYLRIQAKDNAGNIPAGVYTAFVYKLDSTAPTNPSTISVTPTGFTAADNFNFLWNSDASDANSGVQMLQYRTDGDDAGVWTNIPDPSIVSLSLPNPDHIVGAYQSGKNTLYLRTVDNAGNTSVPIAQDYYFSASAPSPPQDLQVDPEYAATNSFYFEWKKPDSFIGEESKLKYYYSINTKPTQYTAVETTTTSVGPGPFATQKGANTFYVVAKDEAGNIDWNLYASKEFVADTSNPPVPGGVSAFDTSDREAQEYSVAVKWSTPIGIDTSNFAGYSIFRSEDNVTFTEVATTSGSAFVDTGLESKLYYYYVKSKDKTNNYSIASTTVSLTPTGRYTTAPKIVQDPSTTIQSFQATFNWATNRVCSSFVEYGETIKLGNTTGQVDSLTDHEVITKGLKAGTKYFYRVKFIDPDGNIGTSDINNFTTLPPPTISEFTISDVGLASATVSYKTNTGGTCILKYGKGAYTSTNEETASSTSHVTKIENLESSTLYSVMTDCLDGDGNTFSSDEYTFTTLRQPVVSEPQVQNKENVDIPTVDVFYKTDEPTTTLIKFKSADEGSYHNYLTSDSVTDHQATVEGLEPAKEYEMILSGISGSGVEAVPQTLKVTTRSDSRPPEVTVNRAVGKVNGRGKDAQATIYIKIETNELTTVKINFSKGVTVSGFDQNTTEDAANTYHLITIPVESGQVYSYQAEAYDVAKNQTVTKANTIVVEEAKQNAAEIVTSTFSNQFGWLSALFKK
jgi:hypothetical protein